MPTIRQIAELAHVSSSTVSRALADSPLISLEVRRRIQQIARELHYRPERFLNPARTGKKGIIGLLLPEITGTFFGDCAVGVLDEAYEQGYHVSIMQTHDDAVRMLGELDALIAQGVEGVILLGYPNLPPASVFKLRGANIALAGVGYMPTVQPVITWALSDDISLAEQIVEYLAGLGHRHLAYLGYTEALVPYSRIPFLTRAMRSVHLTTPCRVLAYDNTTMNGVVESWQAMSPRPTAVIGLSDLLAARFMYRLLQLGYRVPRDVSIVGSGNFPLSEVTVPALTTVEQYPARLGQSVMSLLCRGIAEIQQGKEQTTEAVSVPVQLIIRDSCARPA